MQLTVLGGSSPFAVAFYLALAARGEEAWPRRIVLYGRDEAALALMCAFVSHRLPGVDVQTTSCIEDALQRADIVLHQVRYGGLEGRADDEDYCQALGVAADETLGPGGLRAALRMRPGLEATSCAIAAHSPDAFVINLTNPLSLATALMHHFGVRRVVGVCELPEATGAKLSALVGCPVTFDYVGFNHRGFLYNLRMDGEPAFDAVLAGMGESFEGVGRETVAALGAVPTKYFRMLQGGAPVSPPGRAAKLMALRRRLLGEIRDAPEAVPPSLWERDQPWWDQAVVPLVAALVTRTALDAVLTVAGDGGLAQEARYRVSPGGTLQALPQAAYPPSLSPWLQQALSDEEMSFEMLVRGQGLPAAKCSALSV